VGLTTALLIQEKGGCHVTIVAEIFPTDPKTIKYTSHWAGAHHVTLAAADDYKQQELDRATFKTMWDLSAPGGAAEGCFMRVLQTQYYKGSVPTPNLLEVMPDFQTLPESSLIPGIVGGVSFNTVTIDVPVYLNYLLSRFLASGGSIIRGTVQHLNQVIEGGAGVFSSGANLPPFVSAVVVCAGLGARALGGVEDKAMYPIRGQTVLLRAPWIKFGRTLGDSEADVWTYIIPRRSGDVIIGGTKIENDWYPAPRPETTTDILTRALAVCPELAPPHIRAARQPTVDDLLPIVIENGCGLRPARKGGVRIELEWFRAIGKSGKVPVVYNYGHAGGGYQSSWASASLALSLLEDALAMETDE
jgi:hypothetical protein